MPPHGPEVYLPAAIGLGLGLASEALIYIANRPLRQHIPFNRLDPEKQLLQDINTQIEHERTGKYSLIEGAFAITTGVIAISSPDQPYYSLAITGCVATSTRALIDGIKYLYNQYRIQQGYF